MFIGFLITLSLTVLFIIFGIIDMIHGDAAGVIAKLFFAFIFGLATLMLVGSHSTTRTPPDDEWRGSGEG